MWFKGGILVFPPDHTFSIDGIPDEPPDDAPIADSQLIWTQRLLRVNAHMWPAEAIPLASPGIGVS
jgi:hypothetical protein